MTIEFLKQCRDAAFLSAGLLALSGASGTAAVINVPPGETLSVTEPTTVDGTSTNAGTLLNSSTVRTVNSTFTNIGSLRNFGTFSNSFAATVNNLGTWNNFINSDVKNSGEFKNSISGTLTNAGTFSNEMLGRLTNDGSIENSGRIEIDVSSTVNGNGVFFQSFGTAPTGSFASRLTVNGTMTQREIAIEGGFLEGDGTIKGAVSIRKGGTVIAPGSATRSGILNVDGSFGLLRGASLDIEIRGTAAGVGGYDRLDVDGVATIGSGAQFRFDRRSGIAAGSVFDFLVADEIVGDLASWVFAYPTTPGIDWETSVVAFDGNRQALRLTAAAVSPVPLPAPVLMLGVALLALMRVGRAGGRNAA